MAKKMKGVQLHYGDPHPPQSTIRLWGEAFADDREIQRVGRPSLLKPEEQTEIRKYFDSVRQEGQNVDREVMVSLAETVVEKMRPNLPYTSCCHTCVCRHVCAYCYD